MAIGVALAIGAASSEIAVSENVAASAENAASENVAVSAENAASKNVAASAIGSASAIYAFLRVNTEQKMGIHCSYLAVSVLQTERHTFSTARTAFS